MAAKSTKRSLKTDSWQLTQSQVTWPLLGGFSCYIIVLVFNKNESRTTQRKEKDAFPLQFIRNPRTGTRKHYRSICLFLRLLGDSPQLRWICILSSGHINYLNYLLKIRYLKSPLHFLTYVCVYVICVWEDRHMHINRMYSGVSGQFSGVGSHLLPC